MRFRPYWTYISVLAVCCCAVQILIAFSYYKHMESIGGFDLPPGISHASLQKPNGQFLTPLEFVPVGSVHTISPLQLFEAFQPRMNSTESSWLHILLYTLAKTFERWKINNWFLYGGTLLGCYRFHDMIPWDDDVDLTVDRKDRHRVVHALNNVLGDAEYKYLKFAGQWDLTQKIYRFFSHNFSHLQEGFQWSWPYINIHFHDRNDSYIVHKSANTLRSVLHKDLFFPATLCRLGSYEYPVPANIKLVLRSIYGNVSKCKSLRYDHRVNQLKKRLSIDCAFLTSVYHFVTL